ncbi:DUF2867 domain-containing protein [Streptomyces sp. NPDC050400]|uniref:DUF2867 domain-containing protein n=1 Tax=Streptomyces sp. NPDC050400 TaxID=3365610 RepID=UPI0037A50F02
MPTDRAVRPVIAAAVASLGGYDHVDAVAVQLPGDVDAVEFARRVFTGTPGWVHGLLRARDRLVAPFGLQVQERGPSATAVDVVVGRKVGPFRVLAVSPDEVLCGDDDRHLDFRTSFAVRRSEGGRGAVGVCTTVVRFHGTAGYLYLRAIQPFHRLIVPRALRAATSV